MAIEGDLVDKVTGKGLFVGADHAVEMDNYESDGVTPKNMAGWTIVLDIRRTDTSADPPKLSVTGVVSGVFNISPGSNTQIVTFTIPKALVAASIFPGDDPNPRYSIKRTDTGSEQPLRYGDAPLTRVTQV